ncbi:uncharacterized protein LOC133906367 [Phragmites australis]|uniref:uncharacterized protein LOC133906367 n=1 Tax=Phragmites australis TaxID=29695 RepID=UPI002D76995D|nr:uncharacterized protein LOC133906367 [Phragmites australis]
MPAAVPHVSSSSISSCPPRLLRPMARSSPSPSSTSSRRRLSELLEQQQEPFSLDLYLLEKGCSPALLDAAAGCSYATPTCWPRSSGTGRTLSRQAASNRTRTGGVLRLLLSKILRGTVAAKKKKQHNRDAIDWGRVDGEKQKLPSHVKNAVFPSSPSPRAVGADMEEDEEEGAGEEEKQLSPVSVLEQSLFEQSPPGHAKKAFIIFRELLQAAYTPTLLDLLADAKDINSNPKDCLCNNSASTTAPKPVPPRNTRAQWEDLLEEELARLTDLIASEVAGAWLHPGDVRPERRDVGADIVATVLEALTEETAAELMGMDRRCAVDTAR